MWSKLSRRLREPPRHTYLWRAGPTWFSTPLLLHQLNLGLAQHVCLVCGLLCGLDSNSMSFWGPCASSCGPRGDRISWRSLQSSCDFGWRRELCRSAYLGSLRHFSAKEPSIYLSSSFPLYEVLAIDPANIKHATLLHLVYQRAIQFNRGIAASEVLPRSEMKMLRDNKNQLATQDRDKASSLERLLLDHFRSTSDFNKFYSLPDDLFKDVSSLSLILGFGLAADNCLAFFLTG